MRLAFVTKQGSFSYDASLKSSNLPLVVELVIQGALDALIHGEVGVYLACKYMLRRLYLLDVECPSRVWKRFRWEIDIAALDGLFTSRQGEARRE
jgi:hypothetical protein